MKLKHKLMITFLLISLVPICTVSLIAGYISSDSIQEQAFSQLTSVREIKKSQIVSYFAERKGDIEVLASTVKKIVDTRTPQSLIDSTHNNHDFFANFIKAYDYYDFFIINQQGDIFYTVTKEADYQTNIRHGQFKYSGLAKLIKEVNTTKQFAMADFSPYAPSNNEAASFIALPISTSDGSLITIALQLSITKINEIMQQREGMGETGESYLVGSDYLMRSDSFLDPKGHSVLASFAGSVKLNGVETEATKAALAGKTNTGIIIDYNGNPVLSAYTSINIHGITWAILSEIDVAEAFTPIDELYTDILIVALICLLLVILTALLTASSIIKPLGGEPHDMQTIANTIADGDLTFSFINQKSGSGVYFAMSKMSKRLLDMISDILSLIHI